MSVVKTIKSKTSQDLSCKYGEFSEDATFSQVNAVEQKLKMESSEQKMETLTNEDLRTAAEMFIYLNMCPNLWFKFWASFYNDLFLQMTDKIILTSYSNI